MTWHKLTDKEHLECMNVAPSARVVVPDALCGYVEVLSFSLEHALLIISNHSRGALIPKILADLDMRRVDARCLADLYIRFDATELLIELSEMQKTYLKIPLDVSEYVLSLELTEIDYLDIKIAAAQDVARVVRARKSALEALK